MKRSALTLPGTLAIVLALSACGGSASAGSSPTHSAPAAGASSASAPASTASSTAAASAGPVRSGQVTVDIRNFMFSPMHITVKAGTKVSFHNFDATAHTATALNHAFDSGTINPNSTATVTFTKLGTFSYHCLFHAFMTATIKVVPA